MNGDAITASGLVKAYGRDKVLRGVDLSVAPGALAAVVGENGSGKSTLLRILAGELPPDEGHVEVAGRLGYCPQEPILNSSLTVEQHLAYFAAAYRLESTRRADDLVAALGYEGYRDAVVGTLSGGTRQKLNLTLALMHEPTVLLLDEPYQGFDWETYLRFWELVEDLRDRDCAALLITHLVFEEDRFDTLLELRDGRLEARATRARKETAGV